MHRASLASALFAWNVGGAAWAQEPEPAPAPASTPAAAPAPTPAALAIRTAPPTPEARLDAAVQSYHRGDRDEARRLVAELILDPSVADEDLKQRARIYMGEILYISGDQAGAQLFFQQVVLQDPGYTIDPFLHPPDVVGFFYSIQRMNQPESVDPATLTPGFLPPVPFIAWTWPGAYHLRHGAPTRGTAYLIGEVGLFGGSLATFAMLASDRSYDEDDLQEKARLTQLKQANLGFVLAGGGLWLVAQIDARVHWRQTRGGTQGPSTVVHPVLLDQGAGVGVQARY